MDYLKLTEVYEALDKTTKRLEKTDIIAKFLRSTSKEDIPYIIPLLIGKIFISGDEKNIGVSSKLVLKTLAYSTGIPQKDIEKEWSKIGDLGEVAYNLIKIKKQTTLYSTRLTIKKVLDNIKQLAELVGEGTVSKKVSLMSELLTSATPVEAKYIVRTILEDLRVGTGEGTLRDAIVWAFLYTNIKYDLKENKILIDNREEYNKYIEEVQHAYNLSSDFADIIIKLKEKGGKSLKSLCLKPGSPIKVMLYKKAEDLEDAFEQVGKPAACFPKGERIFSNPSINKIEFLKEKEKVIGKNGKFQNIIKTFKRNYNGNLIKIFPRYIFPLTITPEHRILIVKKQSCSWKNRKIICRPNCQEQKYGCRKNYINYKTEWVKAENIEKGDFILFPKFNEIKEYKKIDLIEFNKDKTIKIENNKIRSYSKLKGTFKGNLINRFIKLTPEFFELMGWYLAEGSFDRNGVTFSLGYKEKKEAERIKELIGYVFSINAKISRRNSVIEIKGHSSLLQNFFRKTFGNYSINKKIPHFIMYAKAQEIKNFVRAYIKGDGHKTKENFYVITTASENIAYQILLLLTKINILPSTGKYKNKGFGDIIYRISIFGKQINNLEKNSHKTKTNHQGFFEDKNLFYIPIKKIENIKYKGEVFNLETEDNTYLSSAIVHNCEYKYDGFRLLLHRDGDKIWLFTRRLDNVTKQFPDVVEVIKKNIKSSNYILDSEVIGIDPKTKKWLPFQDISQRIKRKYDIEKLVKDTPVMVNVFDAIQVDGKNLINNPFKERRELLKKIIKTVPEKLQLAEQIITDDLKKAEKFYDEALKKGNEGVMVKNLEGIYKPGSRVGYGVKVKPILENLDLVITGAQWGEGKRATWLSSFTLSCKDKNKFLEIGKVGTGIKEKGEGVLFIQLTKLLKPLIIISHGKTVEVKPKIIIEIGYQEIQKSPTYSSGFALRFPRVIKLRNDKPLSEISDLEYIKRLYIQQKHKHK